jgi:hypothetical protein
VLGEVADIAVQSFPGVLSVAAHIREIHALSCDGTYPLNAANRPDRCVT